VKKQRRRQIRSAVGLNLPPDFSSAMASSPATSPPPASFLRAAGSFNSSATTGQLQHHGANLSLNSVSALLFELGGTNQAAPTISSTSPGTATLAVRKLNVGFTNGFVATPGQNFTLLNRRRRLERRVCQRAERPASFRDRRARSS